MSNHLILDFPILQEASGDFLDSVAYEVTATRFADKITVTHTLQGSSFVSQLVKQGVARFSVRLLYRDSAERRHHICEVPDTSADNEITFKQVIPLDFSYAPEITPSIIIMEAEKFTVSDSSGLTDFWKNGSQFSIPQYSRIALGPKLRFTSGEVSKLMAVKSDDRLEYGEMRVEVNEHAGEGQTPVSLYCGKGVYKQLQYVTQAEPSNAIESMRSAIVTQALCALYAHMKYKHVKRSDNDYVAGGVLAAHLQMLESKGESWEDGEAFDPSLAATKMWPYAITALDDGE